MTQGCAWDVLRPAPEAFPSLAQSQLSESKLRSLILSKDPVADLGWGLHEKVLPTLLVLSFPYPGNLPVRLTLGTTLSARLAKSHCMRGVAYTYLRAAAGTRWTCKF